MAGTTRLDRLRVENFQSLGKIDLALGPFTVLVGPSNSGKSAALRALKAVARNVNSPSAVRVGKNAFTAFLDFENCTVSIERGKSQSTYRLVLPDGTEEVYTKAGRSVPEDIQKALGLPDPSGPDLVFSSQIDPPYLLNETGSTVAKVLGDLTNVSRLHAAAKESNRRRQEHERIRNIREADMNACVEKFRSEFGDIPEKKAFLAEQREALNEVKDKALLKDELVRLLDDYRLAESAVARTQEHLDSLIPPEDIDALAEKAGRLLGERAVLTEQIEILAKVAQAEDRLQELMEKAKQESEHADKEHEAALAQHGWCPTCGKKVA